MGCHSPWPTSYKDIDEKAPIGLAACDSTPLTATTPFELRPKASDRRAPASRPNSEECAERNGPQNGKHAAACVAWKNSFELPALAPVAPPSITIAPSVKVPLRTITPHRSRAHPGFDTPVSAIQPPPLADLRSPENCPGASWPPTLDGVASTNPHSLRKDKPSELTTTEQARLDFVSSLQQTDPIHTRNWPAATR